MRNWWVAFATLVACSKGPVELDFFTATIGPPPPLDTLRPGMGEQQARQLVPGLTGTSEDEVGELFYDLGRRGVEVRLLVTPNGIDSITFDLERADFLSELEALWGPGRPIERSIVEWEGPHWGASYSCTPSRTRCAVRFDRIEHPLTAEFFGARVGPPGPLAPLRIGMPADEVRRLARTPGRPRGWVRFELGLAHVDATAFLDRDEQVLTALKMHFYRAAAAKEMIAKAWGEGRSLDGSRERCWVGDSWSACITAEQDDTMEIAFARFLPIERVLEDAGPIFGNPPLLGATRAQLATRGSSLLELDRYTNRGELPENELGRMAVELRYDDAGIVEAFELQLRLRAVRDGSRVLDWVAKKWGTPRKLPRAKHEDFDTYDFPSTRTPRVRLLGDYLPGYWILRISRT